MVRRTLITALAALAITSVTVGPASAQRGNPFQRGDRGGLDSQWADPEQDKQHKVSLSDVLRNLRAQYGGRHLDAQEIGNRYVISWITQDGRRLTIEVDAATGRIISTR
jgi:uncharacterized membrane protein YkoI